MSYTTISISDTRLQLPDLAERVDRLGEVFAIEKWGKIKALIVPSWSVVDVDDEKKMLARRKLTMKKYAGMWKDRDDMKDPVKWVEKLRKRESSRYGKIFN